MKGIRVGGTIDPVNVTHLISLHQLVVELYILPSYHTCNYYCVTRHPPGKYLEQRLAEASAPRIHSWC